MCGFRPIHQRRDGLRKLLTQLHTPLIERIDTPHNALYEYLVFVERDQLAERRRIKSREQDQRDRPVARMNLVRNQLSDTRRRQPLAAQVRLNLRNVLTEGE